MIKRTLYFGNPAKLGIDNHRLHIRLQKDHKEEEHYIPLEDIGCVVIDHPQITISASALSRLCAENVAVISCNDSFMPQGIFLNLEGHSNFSERLRVQLAASEPLKKNLWMQTVEAKIHNQYLHLTSRGINADYLIPLRDHVKSGDKDNKEATAATFYWQMLFKDIEGFVRYREGPPPNNMLNYGYAILRSVMARALTASGLLPALGIHHHNKYNAFCLADDIMEPYRPVVDYYVRKIVDEFGTVKELQKEHKALLLKILQADVQFKDEKSPLMVAVMKTAQSVWKCFAGEIRKINYPELVTE